MLKIKWLTIRYNHHRSSILYDDCVLFLCLDGIKQFYFEFFFFYWAPVAGAPYVLQPCWLTLLARLWKFQLALSGAPSRKRGNYGPEMAGNFTNKLRILLHLKGILHAANLRHGTNGFTSPPKEGMLRIFSP
jgi:hypothetical protein